MAVDKVIRRLLCIDEENGQSGFLLFLYFFADPYSVGSFHPVVDWEMGHQLGHPGNSNGSRWGRVVGVGEEGVNRRLKLIWLTPAPRLSWLAAIESGNEKEGDSLRWLIEFRFVRLRRESNGSDINPTRRGNRKEKKNESKEKQQ